MPRLRLLLIAAILTGWIPAAATLSLASPNAQAGSSIAGIPPAEALPSGVRVETVLEGLHLPVAMAFDPSGRLFYVEKDGKVRLFAGGRLQAAPVIEFRVNSQGERGLLGIAIDPDFNTNRYIYVYYTCDDDGGCEPLQNRVVRFTERDGVGSNPVTIFSSIQTAGNHVGGNIHFGPDKMLYITIGDNAQAGNSQDLSVKQGKLHRIRPDGSAPPDNPRFQDGDALPTIYAYGLRNSFDFAFDPVVPGRIFASENGPGCDDEMNRIEAGFNYGWRSAYPCDGPNPNPNFNNIRPLWYIGDNDCCVAPTGITVYTGNSIPEWKNHIFMAVYDGQLYHFTPNADRTFLSAAGTVRGVRANMDLETGPDGALWYMDGGGYTDGTLRRLVGQGQPPPAPSPTPGSGAPTIPGSGSRTFPETGKTVRGIFLDYWDKNGGLAQQGFPISDLLTEVSDLNGKSYTVQYFERAVFEYHPENQPPYNVLLSQLGTFQYRKKYPNGAPGQQANSSEGSVLFKETGKRVGGRFLQYWQQNGGLAQQGYPISEEFTEKSELDGKEYRVQYFERAVFELHPENKPPYDLLLSQLGTFRYREKYSPGRAGAVTRVGSMAVPRADHSATLLANGKVLVAGGMERDNVLLASAELYNPATGTFVPTGSLLGRRVGHTATLLTNGRVLVVGGFGPGVLASAELYDPATGTFAPTGSMSRQRGGFSATLLANGKVLMAGGWDGAASLASAELYDPATGSFAPTGNMSSPRNAHTATLLANGKVLVAGGSAVRGEILRSAEIYDPAAGTFSPAGEMVVARHKHAAIALGNGQVLVVGGSDSRDWRGRYTEAELYDPAVGAFALTAHMGAARFKLIEAVATLDDGRALIAGGGERVEVYDPAQRTFDTAQGALDAARFYSTATRLPGGKVLMAGGYDTSIAATAKAWLYSP